nr:putative reverse transcriptase domain-containing protein [Tanacetum cinerariifolium]
MLDSFGEHAVGFKYQHDMVKGVLFDICRCIGISAKKEAPVNFLTDSPDRRSTLRPVNVLVFGWVGGKHACVDLTGVSPLVGLSSRGFTAGRADLKAASGKVTKHEKACIENQHVFISFVFDTFSFIAPKAVELLSQVQRVMHSNVMTPRFTDVIFKRIGFAIQKRLATQLVVRLPSTTMRVPFERRNERPKHPRVIYLLVLDINHFRYFLNLFENHNPMDDEPMWTANCVVAPTPSPAIIIPKTANEFAIKGNHLNLVKKNQLDEMLRNFHSHNLTKGNIIKIFYHGLNETTREALNAAAGGIFLYKSPNQTYQLLEDKVLLKLDWAKNQKPKASFKKTIAFADEDSSNSDTDKNMPRMDAMTMKIDALYKEIQSRAKCNHYEGNRSTTDYNDDDTPMSREEEAKFMQTF